MRREPALERSGVRAVAYRLVDNARYRYPRDIRDCARVRSGAPSRIVVSYDLAVEELHNEVGAGGVPAGTACRSHRSVPLESTSIAVPGARLEVFDWGSGEPVVFIQTALTADELRPLATDPALDGYRRILYHRRGYAQSSPVEGPGSMARDADDCAALLAELEIDRAHVVGLSFSGAIGLQLACEFPSLATSLTLIEPPPVHTPRSAEFRAANDRLVASREEHGPQAALEEFLTMVIGPDWQQVAEEQLPGSSAQMRQDTRTFFDVDLPALLDWQFTSADAGRIECPVLYVGGTDSGAWFIEVRELMLAWLSHAEDLVIDGADHSLALTHAPQIADALVTFLRRHPT
jgi:pimeloyl-ACP methyl ester carboxylesterase